MAPLSRRATLLALWLSALGLLGLTYLVATGRAFRYWDWALAQAAERATDAYSHTTTGALFAALNRPGDALPSMVLALAAVLVLARRGAGWAAVLPLLLVLTFPVEYATKQIVPSPNPIPDVVMQRSLSLAQVLQEQLMRGYCPPPSGLETGPALRSGCVSNSYLSGAAARIMILAGMALWWVARQRRLGRLRSVLASALVAYVIAAGVGRVYLRWHWPSDVAGGYLLGAVLLCIMCLAAQLATRRAGSAAPPTPRAGSRPSN